MESNEIKGNINETINSVYMYNLPQKNEPFPYGLHCKPSISLKNIRGILNIMKTTTIHTMIILALLTVLNDAAL